MKNNCRPLVKEALLVALLVLSAPVSALDKPKTMEDMWKIIQAQQKQIDEMKASMGPGEIKAVAGNVQIPENKAAVDNAPSHSKARRRVILDPALPACPRRPVDAGKPGFPRRQSSILAAAAVPGGSGRRPLRRPARRQRICGTS